MTYKQAHDALLAKLLPLYEDLSEAKSVCRVFFEDAFGISSVFLAGDFPAHELERLQQLSDQLLRGTPVQYVVGKSFFYGLELAIGPGALIPRPETEELVEWVIERAHRQHPRGRGLHFMDVGTGSGCISIVLKKQLPECTVTALDISPEALRWAKSNAAKHGVAIEFIETDLFRREDWERLPRVDFVVSNPPYVLEGDRSQMHSRVLCFEPATALFVPDADPLRFYKELTILAESRLKAAGWLFVEGHHAYIEEVAGLWSGMSWQSASWRHDLSGLPRLAAAQRSKVAHSPLTDKIDQHFI